MTMVQRDTMKAQLLVTLAACNVMILLPSAVVEVAGRPGTSNEDPDEVTGLEENTLLNSPDFISSPLDENYYKKRTKLTPTSTSSSSSSSQDDNDEIMHTAETYFRPLSRYRELQKEKQQRKKEKYGGTDNEVAAAATAPVVARPPNTNRVYDTKLLSKNPEYCLPVRNGVVCFYKV